MTEYSDEALRAAAILDSLIRDGDTEVAAVLRPSKPEIPDWVSDLNPADQKLLTAQFEDEWCAYRLLDLTAALVISASRLEGRIDFAHAMSIIHDKIDKHGDPTSLLPGLPLPKFRRTMCRVCGGAVPVRGVDPEAQTYVIQKAGYVKIGRTRGDVESRIRSYSKDKPGVKIPVDMVWRADDEVERIAVIPTDVEHGLHERVERDHAGGEWFRDTPHLRRCVAEVEHSVRSTL